MSDRHFPATRAEALAFLYVQSADLSSCSPQEIQAKYFEALGKINADYTAKNVEYLAIETGMN